MLEPEFERLNRHIRAAGEILLHYFGQQLQLTHKTSRADFRTRADLEAEQAIIAGIEEVFPGYNIVAEEQGARHKDSDYTFIIDPLDGTNNFVLGIPAFTSSVALMHGDEIVYGVIHHPFTGDTYYAVRGEGAFLNGAPIRVNAEADERNITVSYYCDYTTPRHRVVGFKTALLNLAIRRSLDLWSPAFCYCGLASGRLEAIINDGIELYDFAAGKLLALEAGAKVTDFEGGDEAGGVSDTFLITNGSRIHTYLLEAVTRPLASL